MKIDRNATKIDLSCQNLTEFPMEILQCDKLQVLDLSYNQLSSLPNEIGNLTSLTSLDLRNNQLSSLPNEIGNLTSLIFLDLMSNQLSSLPNEIINLTSLTHLYLSYNQLSSLPNEITNLISLTHLYLSGNKLSSLPNEITNLTSLASLYFSGNKLSSLPNEITNLTSLTSLNLRNNQLSSLPNEIDKLTKIRQLWLEDNKINMLPEELFSLDFPSIVIDNTRAKYCLNLTNNPLEQPPLEVIKKGRKAILDYFKSLKRNSTTVNEVKLLFLGHGEAGKTSLMKRLVGEEYKDQEKTTHGINIRNWEFTKNDKSIVGKIWDFGGQQVMHSMHQFFLTKRSMYILILEGRREEKPEYWLQMIEAFGGNSPIFVVLNKIDANPRFDVDRNLLLKKYKGICGFFRVSCKKNTGIDTLKDAIRDNVEKVELLGTKLAVSWVNIKKKIEKANKNFLDKREYQKLCRDEKVTGTERQTLVDLLNDLGIVVHFGKERSLNNMFVLKPSWITDGVYRIINSKQLCKAKGRLQKEQLDHILDRRRHSNETDAYIISLMKKFEICYEVDDQTLLIPDLLEISGPVIENNDINCIKFVIQYKFLPKSVMPRFIVRTHDEIKSDEVWRSGVVLQGRSMDATATVICDQEDNRILIDVYGKDRKTYFHVLRREFDKINDSFATLQVSERIPMPEDPRKTVSYSHLLKMQELGQEIYFFEDTEKAYRISDLLDGIYEDKKLNQQEIADLAEDIVNNYQDIEDIRFALMKMNINPDCIAAGKLVLTTFTNVIKKLSAEKKVREFLLILKGKGLIFVDRWFRILNQ